MSLGLASSIFVLGLERVCPWKGCSWPWPREGLSLERLFLALASDFFCVLGLGLEPCVLDSTSAERNLTRNEDFSKRGEPKVTFFAQKLSNLGLGLDQLIQLMRVTDGAWGRNPRQLGDFCDFAAKNWALALF